MAKSMGHPKYETVEELQKAIDNYFVNGIKKRKVFIGKSPNQREVEIEVPTITGLCYYLGFESRQSFYDMAKREELSYTIKRARLLIEQDYEEMLQQGNVVGAIFALKNLGWTDCQQLNIGGQENSVPIRVTFVRPEKKDGLGIS